jgi:hypothetical protein
MRNCTERGQSLDLERWNSGTNAVVSVRDCAFDSVTIITNNPGIAATTDYDYNAFLTNWGETLPPGPHDLIVTNFNWQTSALGAWYLPSNSPLINAGDITGGAARLYWFTTQTNQLCESNSIVDLGYHFVGLEANSNPLDSDGDGIPNYIEDSNGDGIYDAGDLSDWADYYNGVLPVLTIVSGDNQGGATNAFLPLALTVSVKGTNGVVLTNAPITFSVTFGGVLVAASTNGTPVNSLSLRTGTNGQVAVYALLPPAWQTVNYITATAVSGTNNTQVTFIETTFQGLALWLRGDVGVTANASSNISTWADQSTNHNDATQGTVANQPLLVTNALNGKPVVRFNGTNDQLMLATSPGTNNFTVFAVVSTPQGEEIDPEDNSQYSSGGFTGEHYLFGGNVNFNSYGEVGVSLGTNGASVYEYARNQSFGDQFAALAVYNGVVGPGSSILEVSYTNQVPSIYLDGRLVRVGLPSSRSQSALARAIGFGTTGYGNSPFAGDVAEILGFNRVLTDGERSTVESYLNGKYVVVPSVPSSPTNLVATSISSNQVALVWLSTATNATMFRIERKQGAGGTYQEVAQVDSGKTAYVDTGLVASTTYYYRVRAGNLAGNSAYASEANATTSASGTALPLTDLRLWLEGDAGVNLAGDGSGQIWQWSDQSGYNNNANQQTATQRPSYASSQLNGRPVVQFNGTNDQLMLATSPGTNNFTVFAVVSTPQGEEIDPEDNSQYSQGGSTGEHYLFGGNVNFNSYGEVGVSLGTNGVSVYEYARNVYYNDQFAALAVYNGIVGTNFSVVEVSYASQQPSIFINGEIVRVGLPSSRSQSAMARAIGFGTTGYGDSPFAGGVAEILIFNRTLLPNEHNTVIGYLMSKYSLSQYALNTSIPASPTNLVATGITPSQLNVQWAATSSNMSNFNLERKLGTNGTYQTIAAVFGNISNFSDTGVSYTNQYFYRANAENYFGRSGYSPEISPPVVGLTLLSTNAYITVGSTNLLRAQALDADNAISQVAIVNTFNTNASIGSSTAVPYTNAWIPSFQQTYSFTATATDVAGSSWFSPPVSAAVYLDSNGDGIPDYLHVLHGDNPLNPWVPPVGGTNHVPPNIFLYIPTNATLLSP